MSDARHTHETIGFLPVGECAACDQVRSDMRRNREAERQQRQLLSV